ncbi:MAG: synthase [Pseudomonadota bacterium]|jgi:GMP synthase (glutamine-hydrolysing)
MNVLVLDNTLDRDSWGSSDLVQSLSRAHSATIWVRRSPHQDFPSASQLRRFDRLVLSGSRTAATDTGPWISQLDSVIAEAIEAGIPILGVCYGHQAIARVLGSSKGSHLNVRRSATPEIGWTSITRSSEPAAQTLLGALPERFHSFSVHYDEVCDLPRGCVLLASSERCAIQAYASQERPIFGVQFHPERSCEAGEATLKQSAKKKLPFALLNPGRGPHLYSQEVALTIFGNFLKGCV